MPILFLCPSGHLLRAGDENADARATCPTCGHATIVPAKTERAAAKRSRGTAPVEALFAPAATSQSNAHAPPAMLQPLPLPPPLPCDVSDEAVVPPSATASTIPLPAELPAATGYRPDRSKIRATWWLALTLSLVILFSAAPAVPHLDLQLAPGWARVVLLLATLQTTYVVWMALTPDWSTVRVVMIVFAMTSALYGMATAYAIAKPLDSPMPLGMGEIRGSMSRWCGAVLLLMALATYGCGRFSAKWKRQLRLEPRSNR